MPCATFNVEDLFGLTAPAGGQVNESRRDRNVDDVPVDGPDGEVKRACFKTWGTETVMIRGRGVLPIAVLAAGSLEAGEAQVTRALHVEHNDEEQEFELESTGFFTVAAGDDPEPGSGGSGA